MIPRCASVSEHYPPVELADGCEIGCDPGVLPVGQMLRSLLSDATGWTVIMSEAPARNAGNLIRLCLYDRAGIGAGYELSARDGAVTIAAATPEGVFHSVQTLRLLLPPDFLRSAPLGRVRPAAAVPGVLIHDQPRLE